MDYIALDTECTGIDLRHEDVPFAVSACDYEGQTHFWEWPVDPFTRQVDPPKEDLVQIRKVIKDYKKVIFHNAKFDIAALECIGIEPDDYLFKVEDTILMSHILDNKESHRLDDLAYKYLDHPVETTDELRQDTKRARAYGKQQGWSLGISLQQRSEIERDYWMVRAADPNNDILSQYAIQDAIKTAMLYALFYDQLKKQNLMHCYDRRKNLIAAVYDMEDYGVSIRRNTLRQEIDRYFSTVQSLTEKAQSLINWEDTINLNSSKQMQQALFDDLGYTPEVFTKTGASTSKSTLEDLLHQNVNGNGHSFVESVLEMRKNQTAFNYLRGYHDCSLGSRLYPSYNITGTDTTRFSSSNPNTQNVSKGSEWDEGTDKKSDFKLRSVFGPKKRRVWYSIDYSQLQLRIFAYASEDKNLIEAFEKDEDIHHYMACTIFNTDSPTSIERRIGKAVNFGFIFGAQEDKISLVSGRDDIWAITLKLFPNAHTYMKSQIAKARKTGMTYTLGGYPLRLPINKYGNPSAYTAVVYKVQGTEGEIVQTAMVNCHHYLKDVNAENYDPKITMQIHDELVFDFPTGNKKKNLRHVSCLCELMEKAGSEFGVNTPVDASTITKSWDIPVSLS